MCLRGFNKFVYLTKSFLEPVFILRKKETFREKLGRCYGRFMADYGGNKEKEDRERIKRGLKFFEKDSHKDHVHMKDGLDIQSYEFLQSEYDRARRVLRDAALHDWIVSPNQRLLTNRMDHDDLNLDGSITFERKKEGDFYCQGCGKWLGKTMTFNGYVCHWCTRAIWKDT